MEKETWQGKVESLSQLGLGVASITEGEYRRPLFLPFTVPGDEVAVTITKRERKYSFGTVDKVLTPSPHRVLPPCPHFTLCGGCNLEHVSYEKQLEEKAKQVTFLLERQGISFLHPIIVAPALERQNYRWRARILVSFTGTSVRAGFRKFRSHDLEPISECFIVVPEIVELLKTLNTSSSQLNGKLEITAVKDAKGKLWLYVPTENQELITFFESLVSQLPIAYIFFNKENIVDAPTYRTAGYTFSFLPWTFIQSNIATNELLVSRVVALCGEHKPAALLDLYAGIGNFSLPLSKIANIIAVEGDEATFQLGKANAQRNNVQNVMFIHGAVEEYLIGSQIPSTVLLDPPRTGCTPEVLQKLTVSGAERIIYVSCNPVTLGHDLKVLSEAYVIEHIEGIDMFPDISHVETLTVLKKKEV